MKNFKKYALLFTLGAVGYVCIETIWRGHSHWSMALAGGICFILFSLVASALPGRSILLKAVLCALCVTGVELVFGIIFNLILNMDVWDYSHIPFNLLGQICPIFSIFWAGIALAFLPLAELINQSYA